MGAMMRNENGSEEGESSSEEREGNGSMKGALRTWSRV